MADTNETTTPTTEAPAPVEAPAQEPTDWKAEARKWEQRAKENLSAAKRLAEIEEASKSELQKAQERAEAAEKTAARYQSEALRSRVLAEHGITSEYADLVVGDDEDALVASAKKVQSLLNAQPAPAQESASYVVPTEGTQKQAVPLNSSELEDTLKRALGIPTT